ncbi:S8 family peptidase [Flavobacterium litorale]|uniref:S8 family peptidase n=1 Tax=Flavobacterium litorale TaxID=2856519 RepID=A0ABX8V3S0_9FLAO|nr:S8 family peptidase [Flavobacterium litorale]QYJ67486.1 S8 family peptidase [Flavobacterium litorale]
MKNIFIIICGLFFSLSHSQEKNIYTYYIHVNHYSEAPKFQKDGEYYKYVGDNDEERSFFSNYKIIQFSQSFPSSTWLKNLNVFTLSTYNKSLIDDVLKKFPRKYTKYTDITGMEYELLDTYTDDYGTSNNLPNSGVADLSNLDYIGVPKAWDYSLGSSDIILGISDTKVDITGNDLKFKTTHLGFNGSSSSSHGTNVAAFAAAQGDNAHGMVGVCSNCTIINTPIGSYNGLLDLAINGVQVINMSWITSGHDLGANNYVPEHQAVINELHDCYGVILVAGAGNRSEFYTADNISYLYPNGLKYYPASYNHVISVLSVNHRNDWGVETTDSYPPEYGVVSRFVKDLIPQNAAENYNGEVFGFKETAHTTNEDVDICAPGYRLFRYYEYAVQNIIEYQANGGTSAAAPHIAGTIGLMLSVNNCLWPSEAEDVLQLTSKNLEIIPGNEIFAGKSGAGGLIAGDAVEFTHEMKSATGNAVIDGHDFYRFDFNLSHINNKLTISNQTFRDKCTADFTARREIEVLSDTDFKPNADGYIDLKLDPNIDVCELREIPSYCGEDRPGAAKKKTTGIQNINDSSLASKLYPNPNNGTFEIVYTGTIKDILQVEVYDVYGKAVYKSTEKESRFTISVPRLSAGMYIVKLSSDNYTETIKFVKH